MARFDKFLNGPRDFPRVARTMLLARLRQKDIVETAEKEYRRSPQVVGAVKAAVGSIDETSELYSASRLTTDYAAFVQKQSILGRIPDPLHAPLVTQLPFVSARSAFGFYGDLIPAKALTFGTNINLAAKKIGGIIVFSRELLERSNSEAFIRAEMTQGLVEALDSNLLDPSLTTTDDRPGAVTAGATEVDATGADTAADVDGVIGDLLSVLATSNFAKAVFVMDHTAAVALSLLRDSGGGRAYPGMTATGGILAGIPAVASASAPASQLAVIDAGELLVGDESEIEIVTSTEGFISQSDDPDNEDTWVPLFQTESIALRITRVLNWQMRRSGHVAYASSFAPPAPSFESTTA